MTPALRATARFQAGVFTLLQAKRAGVGASAVRRWRASGRCWSPANGVYVVSGAPETDAQQAWIAVLAAGEPCAVAGVTAARLHRLVGETTAAVDQSETAPAPEIVVPVGRYPRTTFGQVRRSSRWPTFEFEVIDGLQLLSVPDTIATLPMSATFDEVLAMIQTGIYDGRTSAAALLRRCGRGLPGSRRLRAAATSYLCGHDSGREAEVFRALTAARMAPDHCNVILVTPDGRRTSALDGYLEVGVGYDYDGRSAHSRRGAAERDAWKDATVTSCGVSLVRLDARDLKDRDRLLSRMRRAIADRRNAPDVTVVHLPRRSCVCGHQP